MNKERKVIIVLVFLIILLSLTYIFKINEYEKINKDYTNLVNGDNLIIPKEEAKAKVIEYESIIDFASWYFPDKFIYFGYDGISFLDIDETLVTNNYRDKENKSNFSYLNNRLVYKDDSGLQTMTGIDVSYHQGDIDWQKVKDDGIQYAFIRVGYRGYESGEIVLDSKFEDNIKGANEVGIDVGVYFFSGANTIDEGIEEAKFVLENIKPYNVSLEVVFDMEDIDEHYHRMIHLETKDKTAITKAFCDHIKSNGYTPMVYGNSKWLIESLNYNEIEQYPIWYANWSNYHWPYRVDYYQYTDSGMVAGINTLVDMNIKFPSLEN